MTQDNAGVKFPPPLIYLIGMLVGYVIDRVRPLPIFSLDRDLLRRSLGWLAIVAFLAFASTAIGLFRRARTSLIPRRPTTALVESGPYRVTRNPMYVSFGCLMIGVALLTNAVWMLLLVPVVLLIVDRAVIQREEQYLERVFGNEYREYKTRVRRWL